MLDIALNWAVWIIGPALLAAAFIWAMMRRRRSGVVTLPPDHPAHDHLTQEDARMPQEDARNLNRRPKERPAPPR